MFRMMNPNSVGGVPRRTAIYYFTDHQVRQQSALQRRRRAASIQGVHAGRWQLAHAVPPAEHGRGDAREQTLNKRRYEVLYG